MTKATLPPDFPIAAGISPRETRAGSCRHLCVGGNRCVSNSRYAHVYHMCKDEKCACRWLLRKGVAKHD